MSGVARVLVVDDDALVRSGLQMLLDGADGVDVVGTAADGDEVPGAVRRLRPDVVLMDIRMRRVDGIAATRGLRRHDDGPAVIVLTTFDGDDEVLDALHAGADGFLLKDTPPDRLVAAIRSVAAGDPVLSPAVTRRLMDRTTDAVGHRDRARRQLARLSDREREVAHELAAGRPNRDIADTLHMSVATVKAHVSSIFLKLDLSNRTQIALLVQQADDGGAGAAG